MKFETCRGHQELNYNINFKSGHFVYLRYINIKISNDSEQVLGKYRVFFKVVSDRICWPLTTAQN